MSSATTWQHFPVDLTLKERIYRQERCQQLQLKSCLQGSLCICVSGHNLHHVALLQPEAADNLLQCALHPFQKAAQ